MRNFTFILICIFYASIPSIFATESIFELNSSPKYLSISKSCVFSDKALFMVNNNFSKIDLYDVKTVELIKTFDQKNPNIIYNATSFTYINEADTSVYYSSGDTTTIKLIKYSPATANHYDTLDLGPNNINKIMYYLSYDRKTLYAYQNMADFQSIDLKTMKVNFKKPVYDDFKVLDFAVDENFNLLHIAGTVEYQALKISNYEEYKSVTQYSASAGIVRVSPDGKTAIYLTEENQGYGPAYPTLIDIPTKTASKPLPAFQNKTNCFFVDNNYVAFESSVIGLQTYSIADNKFLNSYTKPTIACPFNYEGKAAMLVANPTSQLSVYDVANNTILKNYFNQYNPVTIFGDTLVVKNSGIIEYWNYKTNTKLFDTLISFGRISNTYRKSVTFPDDKIVYRNLNTLAIEDTITLPFTSDYVSIAAMNLKCDRFLVQLGLSKDSIVEYDAVNDRIIDTFSINFNLYYGNGVIANSLKYCHEYSNYSKVIYKTKSNDTLVNLINSYKFTFSNDGEFGLVLDTNLNIYRLNLNNMETTTPVKLPLDNKYSWSVAYSTTQMMSNDNKYAFVFGKCLIDTTSTNVMWVVDMEKANIVKTVVFDTIQYIGFNQISDDAKCFLMTSQFSISLFSAGNDNNGIDDMPNELNSTIQVYPQPANNFVAFESKAGIINSIQIYDNTGKIIFNSNSIGSSILELSTQSLSSGIYHYCIQTDANTESGNFIIK